MNRIEHFILNVQPPASFEAFKSLSVCQSLLVIAEQNSFPHEVPVFFPHELTKRSSLHVKLLSNRKTEV